jgi:putative membrane protein
MTATATVLKRDSNALAEERTDLALQRTIMAADRTLMAWVRTAISMIGFGFTIYKFLQYLGQENPAGTLPIQGPRNLGLTFIGLGIGSLVIAVAQNWRTRAQFPAPGQPRFSLSLAVAAIVALIGVLAFMNVLLRIGPF